MMEQYNGEQTGSGREPTVQSVPLSDQVYEFIWRHIAAHRFRPGDKLSDLRISAELGVSRTPVREALHRLAQDGIVRAERHRGFFVTTFSSHDVHEIYDLRTALEVLAVRLALPHLSEAELQAARAALDEVALRLGTGDEQAGIAFLKLDRDFHDLFVQRARNRRLAALMASLRAQIAVFQMFGIHRRAILKLSLEHHRVILTALQQRHAKAAEEAMQRHIQEVKEWVLAEFISQETNPQRE